MRALVLALAVLAAGCARAAPARCVRERVPVCFSDGTRTTLTLEFCAVARATRIVVGRGCR